MDDLKLLWLYVLPNKSYFLFKDHIARVMHVCIHLAQPYQRFINGRKINEHQLEKELIKEKGDVVCW